MKNSIIKADSNGNIIATWGSYGTADGQFNSPSVLIVDAPGNIYIADSGNDYSYFISTIAIDQHNNVYTIETNYPGEQRIQKYDSLGNPVTTIQSYGHSLALSPDGAVYTISNNSENSKISPVLHYIKGKITDLNDAGIKQINKIAIIK